MAGITLLGNPCAEQNPKGKQKMAKTKAAKKDTKKGKLKKGQLPPGVRYSKKLGHLVSTKRKPAKKKNPTVVISTKPVKKTKAQPKPPKPRAAIQPKPPKPRAAKPRAAIQPKPPKPRAARKPASLQSRAAKMNKPARNPKKKGSSLLPKVAPKDLIIMTLAMTGIAGAAELLSHFRNRISTKLAAHPNKTKWAAVGGAGMLLGYGLQKSKNKDLKKYGAMIQTSTIAVLAYGLGNTLYNRYLGTPARRQVQRLLQQGQAAGLAIGPGQVITESQLVSIADYLEALENEQMQPETGQAGELAATVYEDESGRPYIETANGEYVYIQTGDSPASIGELDADIDEFGQLYGTPGGMDDAGRPVYLDINGRPFYLSDDGEPFLFDDEGAAIAISLNNEGEIIDTSEMETGLDYSRQNELKKVGWYKRNQGFLSNSMGF